ncbi:hypothetical protein ACFY0B_25620 [Streptomyces sp. NPDC001797]|uniref:hypothetical protein n=1 Tax=Streptomyces sp. NPDC001797 TaxID=3364610 RepID=UPI0036A8781D
MSVGRLRLEWARSSAPNAELVAGTDYMPFQQVATQPFSLHVAYTTNPDMSADLNDGGSLKVSGYVYYEDPSAKWPAKPTVTLQYSKDGKTGWKNATTVPLPIRHNKPLTLETFAHTLTAPDTDAYWRARFDGNPDLTRWKTSWAAQRLREFHRRQVPYYEELHRHRLSVRR